MIRWLEVSLRRAFALMLATLLLLPLFSFVTAEAQTAPARGPAVDRVEWFRVNLPDVEAAITAGRIDLYIFGRIPSDVAVRLAATPGIRVISASAGLTDIVLNPAPVHIVRVSGNLDKDTVALRLGVNPVVVRNVKFLPAERVTEVELCGVVDPLPAGFSTVFKSDRLTFNPFCIRDIRFELNYVFDRERIAREVYRGFAQIKYTFYGPDDPTYTEVADIVAKYAFKYDFERARRRIADIMTAAGADLQGGKWVYKGKTVDIIGIIRTEDERLLLGRAFALELVKLGFNVIPSELTFGPAISIVYGTNPIDFRWSFYTEGWGKGALDRFDSGNLAQFGSAILGYLPGWGDATYWNYAHDLRIDGKNATEYAEMAYQMKVKSRAEWVDALRKGTELGLLESIRIWGFATQDRWPVRADVQGLTVDLGAGLRSPYNCRGWFVTGRTDIKVGHLWVFTATTAWNTYRGFRDVYSVDPARCTFDFTFWRHPFTGMPIPFRARVVSIETAGPDGKLAVPADALWFDAARDRWVAARELGRTEATSKVVFNMSLFLNSNWHYGRRITMGDFMGALALYLDAVYDAEKARIEPEYVSVNKPYFDTVVAVKPVGSLLEVYVNYWHFERSYIADWAAGALATSLPFELVAAQDYVMYVSKERAGSTTRASRDRLPYMSLVLRSDAELVIRRFADGNITYDRYVSFITPPGASPLITREEFAARVAALRSWFERTGTVWVSNGPYSVASYSPDEQRLVLVANRDPTYPFGPRDWVFGEAVPVRIVSVDTPLVPVPGKADITVRAEGRGEITVIYIIRDPETLEVIASGAAVRRAAAFVISLTEEVTGKMLPFRVYDVLIISYSSEVAVPVESVARIQTLPAGLVGQLGEVEQSVEQLNRRLEEINTALSRRIDEVTARLSAEVAASLRALSDTMRASIADLGRATSDSIRALGAEVGKQIGELRSTTEQQITTVETKVTKEIDEVRQISDAAQSNARWALIVSAINLLLLVAVAVLIYTRK
ncbi:MAG: hypothetical protein N3D79_01035 [Acidilobaceae archaeon]|nr:hypothetical protein [Acidilobaceae archaeon]